MFGLAENAQLKMHSVNLTRSQNFARDHGNPEPLRSAIVRAVSSIAISLGQGEDTPIEVMLEQTPLEHCDAIADFLMKAAEEPAKSTRTLGDYYALDLLSGLFRSRTIEFRRPKLTPKTSYYRHGTLHLINYYLSQKKKDEATDEERAPKTEPFEIAEVEQFTNALRLKLTPYGAGIALLSTQSGYSPAEAASHLALLTFARDYKEADKDITVAIGFIPRGTSVLRRMKEWKDKGLMCEEIWRNDSTAMGKIMFLSPETFPWIERVLSDPVDGVERLASFEG